MSEMAARDTESKVYCLNLQRLKRNLLSVTTSVANSAYCHQQQQQGSKKISHQGLHTAETEPDSTDSHARRRQSSKLRCDKEPYDADVNGTRHESGLTIVAPDCPPEKPLKEHCATKADEPMPSFRNCADSSAKQSRERTKHRMNQTAPVEVI